MNSIDDLVTLVRDELGLPLTAADADRKLSDLEGWDSVHLLWLLTALERSTGRRISMPDVLEAGTLADIHALATAT